MHIAIAGNIGSGKTTLAGLLARQYGWVAHYEDADDNPYLNDFYEDKAFHSLIDNIEQRVHNSHFLIGWLPLVDCRQHILRNFHHPAQILHILPDIHHHR